MVKLKIRGPSGCCDCDQTTGCDCAEGLGCSLDCQQKNGSGGGFATLCGYSEIGPPSLPPKKYLHYTIKSTGGLFQVCSTFADDCGGLTCPGDYFGSATGQSIFGATVDWEAQLTFASNDGTNSTYNYVSSGSINGTPGADIFLNRDGSGTKYHNGDVVVIPNGMRTITISVGFIFDQELDSKCMLAGGPIQSSVGDDWDIEKSTNAATCSELVGDSSTRLSKTGGPNPCDPTGGSSAPLGLSDPETAYGSSAVVVTHIDSVTTTVDGAGCVAQISYFGTVTKRLDTENTEADAIDRANAGVADWSAASCQDDHAFITQRGAGEFTFAYRSVQTRAVVGTIEHPLIVGHGYTVTIRFERRAIGVGPWLLIGLQEIVFTATVTIGELTPWIDVPNSAGFETRPRSCFYLEIM